MMLGGVLPNVESSRHSHPNGAPACGGHRRAYAECTPLAQFGTNFDSALLKKHSLTLSPQGVCLLPHTLLNPHACSLSERI